jgi:2-hydroxychromene-2-carboxylate isomerase
MTERCWRGDSTRRGSTQGAARNGRCPEHAERLEKNMRLAGDRGVFGSPTFIVGEDVFFGNDRLEFLEERLRS